MPAPYRALLVLPLAYGVCIAVVAAVSMLGEPDQARSFYLVNTAIFLAPGVAYGAAAVLFLSGRQRPVAWLVLLACGLVLIVLAVVSVSEIGLVGADASDYLGLILEPLLLPLYLSVLAGVEIRARRARRSLRLADQRGHHGESHVQRRQARQPDAR